MSRSITQTEAVSAGSLEAPDPHQLPPRLSARTKPQGHD